jgi:uncharacterized protein (DUF302 family)/uncharacterized membrane protein YidH (DUF202 family)
MTERPGSLADYLAAERTFLAWIRTGLALMGFGFVVARFGLYLQTLRLGPADLALRGNGISPWIGTALIAMGIAVDIWCAVAHVRLVRQLKQGESAFGRPSALALGLAVMLGGLGLAMAMAIYLVSVGESRNSNVEEKSMNSSLENGIVTLLAHQSVDETVLKLEHILEAKAVKLFAVIDHSGEAHKAGLEMPPTKLLIFGNPKAGTPLMIASPLIAIDLPLKVLVHEDRDGQTLISYNALSYLQARHTLPADLIEKIAVVEVLATAAAE